MGTGAGSHGPRHSEGARNAEGGGGGGAISETQVTSAATPLLLPLTAKRGDAHVDDADTTAAGLLSARPHLNGISHIVGRGRPKGQQVFFHHQSSVSPVALRKRVVSAGCAHYTYYHSPVSGLGLRWRDDVHGLRCSRGNT